MKSKKLIFISFVLAIVLPLKVSTEKASESKDYNEFYYMDKIDDLSEHWVTKVYDGIMKGHGYVTRGFDYVLEKGSDLAFELWLLYKYPRKMKPAPEMTDEELGKLIDKHMPGPSINATLYKDVPA